MPRGAHIRFLRLTEREPKRAARATALALLVLALLFALADVTDPRRLGTFTRAAIAGALVGAPLGAAWALRTWRRLNESVRFGWDPWQQASEGSGSVLEAARRVSSLGPLPPHAAWALVLPVLAFMVAWFREPPWAAGVMALLAILYALSAILAIAAAVHGGAVAVWSRRVHRSTEGLIREGRMGVWGSL